MKLIDLKTIDFINQVDSNSPAPGGGSVSALLSSLGVSLTRMVGHLTVTKKKYLNLDQDVKEKFEHHLSHLESIKNELISLVDQDTDSFNQIMNAYKLPKEDKVKRDKAIEDATLDAIKIPYKVSSISLKVLRLLPFILEYGNIQTISDLGVAALSLSSGIEGALLNVLINLPGISDPAVVSLYKLEYSVTLNETKALKNSILDRIYQLLLI